VNDPNNGKIILAHIGKNDKLPLKFFSPFFFNFFFKDKGLVSNAQVNSNIRKRQLPGNGAKNLLGKLQALKFINPNCDVSSLAKSRSHKWDDRTVAHAWLSARLGSGARTAHTS